MSHIVLVLHPIFDTRLFNLMYSIVEFCYLLMSVLGAEEIHSM
jgi:hypothetical protein